MTNIRYGHKSFACRECDYSSTRAEHLRRHMRKHTGEKPYKCGQCDFAWITSSHLKWHIKQAQANAEHVREPTTKAKARRAQNGTRNCVFSNFESCSDRPTQFHAVGSVICGKSGQFYFQIDFKACSSFIECKMSQKTS